MRYGSFVPPATASELARVGVLTAGGVLDLTALHADHPVPWPELLVTRNLDPLLAAGRPIWREVHGWLRETLVDPERLRPYLRQPATVTPLLAFTVADYVDFFACEQHAANAARIFRPQDEPLTPNWKHLPVGYHGRSGTIRGSGSPVHRPTGQRGPADFGPTRALDFEAELGFVLGGPPTQPGESVSMARAEERVFGLVLLNDWSARDIQAWESRPLGPLLGKAFATSISSWVTPWDELAAARVDPPPRNPEPLPYLRGPGDRGLDLSIEVRLNGEVITRPPGRVLYWTAPQLVAHLTCGGATLRPGDLLGSGTISGPERAQRGCLLELSWGGREPLRLADGTELTYLRDGDELVISATAPSVHGGRLELGEVRGEIRPALG
jgi:fumarylacetoacetase